MMKTLNNAERTGAWAGAVFAGSVFITLTMLSSFGGNPGYVLAAQGDLSILLTAALSGFIGAAMGYGFGGAIGRKIWERNGKKQDAD